MGLLSARQRMGAAALILAASTVLSRLMGLVRDKIISWQFGAGGEADMYFAAFVVPDIINYLLAGGFMSITIIPLLTRRFQEDADDAWRFFSCVFCWMATAATLLTFAGMAGAGYLARLVAPGFTPEQWQRLAFFMRIILPAQIFFLCGACITALLFMRRQFRVPALAPLIYNGSIILLGLALPALAHTPPVRAVLPASLLAHMDGMTGYCVGVTLGAALGTFVIPLLVAARQELRLSLIWRHALMGKFLLTALPLMLGQTVIMLDEQFLRVFGSLVGDGAVSLLNYARRITQVPVGLVGQAAAVASYPFLVSLLARGERERFDATLRTALAGSIGLIIPCALCMVATAWPVLGVIFQGGRFGTAETLATLPLTRIMLAATPFWILYMVLVRAYYAHGDTLTPAVTGTIMTLCCLPCYYWWAVPRGAWAIAVLSGVSVACYVLWLTAIWCRRQGTGALTGLTGLALRVTLISLPATAGAWYCAETAMQRLSLSPIVTAGVSLALGGTVFAVLFVPLAVRCAPEVLQPVLRRLRRE
ncbi:MAG: murein biosynthesis integral membrane protein MurJ [Desulfovibrio sp.]|nr:murein biosynthesis integral membrane protein MurJ [Desulfovibrio sp.]